MGFVVAADAGGGDCAVVGCPYVGGFAPGVVQLRKNFRLRIGVVPVVRRERRGVDRAAVRFAGRGGRDGGHFHVHRQLMRLVVLAGHRRVRAAVTAPVEHRVRVIPIVAEGFNVFNDLRLLLERAVLEGRGGIGGLAHRRAGGGRGDRARRVHRFGFHVGFVVAADAGGGDCAVVGCPYVGGFAPGVVQLRKNFRLRIGVVPVVRREPRGVDRAAVGFAGRGGRNGGHFHVHRQFMRFVVLAGHRRVGAAEAAPVEHRVRVIPIVVQFIKDFRLRIGVGFAVGGERGGVDRAAVRFAGGGGGDACYRRIYGQFMRCIVGAGHRGGFAGVAVPVERRFAVQPAVAGGGHAAAGGGLRLERFVREGRRVGGNAHGLAAGGRGDRGHRVHRLAFLVFRVVAAHALGGAGLAVFAPAVGGFAPGVAQRFNVFQNLRLYLERAVLEGGGGVGGLALLGAGGGRGDRARCRYRFGFNVGMVVAADAGGGDLRVILVPDVGGLAPGVVLRRDHDPGFKIRDRRAAGGALKLRAAAFPVAGIIGFGSGFRAGGGGPLMLGQRELMSQRRDHNVFRCPAYRTGVMRVAGLGAGGFRADAFIPHVRGCLGGAALRAGADMAHALAVLDLIFPLAPDGNAVFVHVVIGIQVALHFFFGRDLGVANAVFEQLAADAAGPVGVVAVDIAGGGHGFGLHKRMAGGLDHRMFAAELFTAHRAVYHGIIAAFGGAAGLRAVFFHRLAGRMAERVHIRQHLGLRLKRGVREGRRVGGFALFGAGGILRDFRCHGYGFGFFVVSVALAHAGRRHGAVVGCPYVCGSIPIVAEGGDRLRGSGKLRTAARAVDDAVVAAGFLALRFHAVLFHRFGGIVSRRGDVERGEIRDLVPRVHVAEVLAADGAVVIFFSALFGAGGFRLRHLFKGMAGRIGLFGFDMRGIVAAHAPLDLRRDAVARLDHFPFAPGVAGGGDRDVIQHRGSRFFGVVRAAAAAVPVVHVARGFTGGFHARDLGHLMAQRVDLSGLLVVLVIGAHALLHAPGGAGGRGLDRPLAPAVRVGVDRLHSRLRLLAARAVEGALADGGAGGRGRHRAFVPVVAQRRDLFIGGVGAAGAGIVGRPADLRAGGCLRLVMDKIMSQRRDRYGRFDFRCAVLIGEELMADGAGPVGFGSGFQAGGGHFVGLRERMRLHGDLFAGPDQRVAGGAVQIARVALFGAGGFFCVPQLRGALVVRGVHRHGFRFRVVPVMDTGKGLHAGRGAGGGCGDHALVPAVGGGVDRDDLRLRRAAVPARAGEGLRAGRGAGGGGRHFALVPQVAERRLGTGLGFAADEAFAGLNAVILTGGRGGLAPLAPDVGAYVHRDLSGLFLIADVAGAFFLSGRAAGGCSHNFPGAPLMRGGLGMIVVQLAVTDMVGIGAFFPCAPDVRSGIDGQDRLGRGDLGVADAVFEQLMAHGAFIIRDVAAFHAGGSDGVVLDQRMVEHGQLGGQALRLKDRRIRFAVDGLHGVREGCRVFRFALRGAGGFRDRCFYGVHRFGDLVAAVVGTNGGRADLLIAVQPGIRNVGIIIIMSVRRDHVRFHGCSFRTGDIIVVVIAGGAVIIRRVAVLGAGFGLGGDSHDLAVVVVGIDRGDLIRGKRIGLTGNIREISFAIGALIVAVVALRDTGGGDRRDLGERVRMVVLVDGHDGIRFLNFSSVRGGVEDLAAVVALPAVDQAGGHAGGGLRVRVLRQPVGGKIDRKRFGGDGGFQRSGGVLEVLPAIRAVPVCVVARFHAGGRFRFGLRQRRLMVRGREADVLRGRRGEACLREVRGIGLFAFHLTGGFRRHFGGDIRGGDLFIMVCIAGAGHARGAGCVSVPRIRGMLIIPDMAQRRGVARLLIAACIRALAGLRAGVVAGGGVAVPLVHLMGFYGVLFVPHAVGVAVAGIDAGVVMAARAGVMDRAGVIVARGGDHGIGRSDLRAAVGVGIDLMAIRAGPIGDVARGLALRFHSRGGRETVCMVVFVFAEVLRLLRRVRGSVRREARGVGADAVRHAGGGGGDRVRHGRIHGLFVVRVSVAGHGRGGAGVTVPVEDGFAVLPDVAEGLAVGEGVGVVLFHLAADRAGIPVGIRRFAVRRGFQRFGLHRLGGVGMGGNRLVGGVGTRAAFHRTTVGADAGLGAGGLCGHGTRVPGVGGGVAVLLAAVYALKGVRRGLPVAVAADFAGVAVVLLRKDGIGLLDLLRCGRVAEILIAAGAIPVFDITGGKAGGCICSRVLQVRMVIGIDLDAAGLYVMANGALALFGACGRAGGGRYGRPFAVGAGNRSAVLFAAVHALEAVRAVVVVLHFARVAVVELGDHLGFHRGVADGAFLVLAARFKAGGGRIHDPVAGGMGEHRDLSGFFVSAHGAGPLLAAFLRAGRGLGYGPVAVGGFAAHRAAVLFAAVHALKGVRPVAVVSHRAGVAVLLLREYSAGLGDLRGTGGVAEIFITAGAVPVFDITGGKAGIRHSVGMGEVRVVGRGNRGRNRRQNGSARRVAEVLAAAGAAPVFHVAARGAGRRDRGGVGQGALVIRRVHFARFKGIGIVVLAAHGAPFVVDRLIHAVRRRNQMVGADRGHPGMAEGRRVFRLPISADGAVAVMAAALCAGGRVGGPFAEGAAHRAVFHLRAVIHLTVGAAVVFARPVVGAVI